MRTQPPGPSGLPVVANTYHYARDPLSFLTACQRAYGDVARFRLGTTETYMLSNPDDIERVLLTEQSTYGKAKFGDRAVNALLGEGLLVSEGDTWKRQRQLAQPAFRMSRIASLTRTMAEKTHQLLNRLKAGETIDIQSTMARLTVEIIVEAMFGVSLDRETVCRIQENIEPIGARFEPDPIRFLVPDWLPTEENRRYDEALSVLDSVLDDVLEARRREDSSDENDDLLSILLRAKARGEQTDQQVRDEMMTMLLAGHDTTALTLTYTWYLLGRNQSVERRLHGEVDGALGDVPPTMAHLRELTYTERVIQEAMRLYPPVYALFRQPKVDVRHDGYRIPADSLLVLPQWVVHRDADYWDEPLAFDPERWRPKRASTRPDYAYFPFGAGPRHCIGKQFSLVEAKLILSMVAREYRLELATERDIEFRPSITMHPRDPVEVTLRERTG